MFELGFFGSCLIHLGHEGMKDRNLGQVSSCEFDCFFYLGSCIDVGYRVVKQVLVDRENVVRKQS